MALLIRMTRKDTLYKWEAEEQLAFDTIKKQITARPVLIMLDPDQPIELETDASEYVLGAQLGQREE